MIHETDVPGTLADLSHLADIYLQTVYQLAREEMRQSEGNDNLPDNFAIIGLGKLGGQEINFGSDLDLVFVYEEDVAEKEVPHSENLISTYVSLAQKIYQLTSMMAPVPPPYEIDTDLRPEGSRGALVLSIKGYQEYFETRGKIWEQQAMTRARFIAGSRTPSDIQG